MRNKNMRLAATLVQLYLLVCACMLHAAQVENADSIAATQCPVVINASSTARIFADSDSIGTTPLTAQLTTGRHILRIMSESDANSWASEPIVDTIMVEADKPLTLNYAFRRKIFLNSAPTGTDVFREDSLLGSTPLFVYADEGPIILRRSGFEEQKVSLHEGKNLQVELKRVWQSGADSSIFQDSEVGHSSLRLYISGAATIIAGATSAYFKVKADNSYSSFVRSGNPAQLADTDRYDTAAAVAIAATQLSLGLFTYFILSE